MGKHSIIAWALCMFVLVAMSSPSAASDTTELVSVSSTGAQGNCWSYYPSVSEGGGRVAFESCASTLVPGDTNNAIDIFVRDVDAGTTQRVSVSDSGGQALASSYEPVISGNGRYVAFISYDNTLVPTGYNRSSDVYVRDLDAGTFEVASSSYNGAYVSYGQAYTIDINYDGRYVAFNSNQPYMVPGASDWFGHVYVRDRATGITERVSVTPTGERGNYWSKFPSLSGDGRYVAFISWASNLVPGDTNGKPDYFVHDRLTGSVVRVSVDADGNEAPTHFRSDYIAEEFAPFIDINGDGSVVAFQTMAALLPMDTNNSEDIYVRDLAAGTLDLASVSSTGNIAAYMSVNPSISADGTKVAFRSCATNLVPSTPPPPCSLVYVHDRLTGATTLASLTDEGTVPNAGTVYSMSISPDGSAVAFSSYANNLVPGDTNGQPDIFVRRPSPVPTTPEEAMAAIESFVDAGLVSPSDAGMLQTSLETASAAPNANAQDGALGSFINKVNALLNSGRLDAETAAFLTDAVSAMRNNN